MPAPVPAGEQYSRPWSRSSASVSSFSSPPGGRKPAGARPTRPHRLEAATEVLALLTGIEQAPILVTPGVVGDLVPGVGDSLQRFRIDLGVEPSTKKVAGRPALASSSSTIGSAFVTE